MFFIILVSYFYQRIQATLTTAIKTAEAHSICLGLIPTLTTCSSMAQKLGIFCDNMMALILR